MQSLNNINKGNNMEMDPLEIALSLKRRPAYVQCYCILKCVSMDSKLRLYQIARLLGLDYYQVMKRVSELSSKGFLQIRNGVVNITDDGLKLRDSLENLIMLLHTADAKHSEKRINLYDILA
jgi:predicted transcriptional regulator